MEGVTEMVSARRTKRRMVLLLRDDADPDEVEEWINSETFHSSVPAAISNAEPRYLPDKIEVECHHCELTTVGKLNLDEPSERAGNNTPEPAPESSEHQACWDYFFELWPNLEPAGLAQDIRDRDAAGATKYGTRLRPFNGRNARVDAYQELLDAIVYHVQLVMEEGSEGGNSGAAERRLRHTVTLLGMARQLRAEI